MLLSNADIVQNRRLINLDSGEAAEALLLNGGPALVLKPDAIALYRSLEALFDPLQSACMAYTELPEGHKLAWHQNQIMQEHKAGYIGLHDGRVLLITPNNIRLYHDKHSALHHIEPIAELLL